MDEPKQQQQNGGRALPAWANQYEARKRNDPNESTYQEYDDMDLWDDEEIAMPAPRTALPPVQDYLGMIQQTKKDIEQAEQKRREQERQRKQQQQQQQVSRPAAGSGRGRGRGRGTNWQAGRSTSGPTATSQQRETVGRDADADMMDLSEVNIIEKEKKPRKPVPRLDAEKLLGEQGLPLLRKYGQTFKIQRKYNGESEKRANAKDNLARMMAMCQTWGDNLFPKATFSDFIRMAESKCKNDERVKVTMSTWRDEHFEKERLKREAMEEQLATEAAAAAGAAAAAAPDAMDDEIDLDSIFPVGESNGGSSSASTSRVGNGALDSTTQSPYKHVAARTPSQPVVASHSSQKSRPPVELDNDDGDDSDESVLQRKHHYDDVDLESSSDEDPAATLNRIRQQRAARLAAMQSQPEPSTPAAAGAAAGESSTQDLATQPLGEDHNDNDDAERMNEEPDQPEEEHQEVSSQRRRRRLIVDESDDDD
ncbi:chromosome segregation in meiosis- protein [Actinomortierella ambigua]|nr:chromosome segregation in meiosis- protein [Actinomortierella ambigua]